MTRTKTTIAALVTAALLSAAYVVSATPGVTAHPGGHSHKAPADDGPDLMGWVGFDGKVIVCPDGEPLKVSDAEIRNAPNLGESVEVGPAGDGVTEYRGTEGMVPRCGPGGGGAEGTPIFVPNHVAKQTGEVAPRRFREAQTR